MAGRVKIPGAGGKPYCCEIECQRDATVRIWDGPGNEDYTESCDEHIETLRLPHSEIIPLVIV